MFHSLVHSIVSGLLTIASNFLFPLMFLAFGAALVLKGLVLASTQRQVWFAKEFEKRVVRFLEKAHGDRTGSFYHTTKKLLELTYYQLFEVRGIMMHRKLDYVSTPIDRLFGTQAGCAVTVKDTLEEIKYLNKDKDQPDFLDVAKSTFSRNPYFSKLFAWVPLGPLNDLINLVPGLFIITGIFGTFLGIMEGLPQLSHLNLQDPESSKLIMDTFLLKVSFSISASVLGILFSVTLTILFSLLAPEKKYMGVVDNYQRCLTRLWEYSLHNQVSGEDAKFNEHRDPLEALAEISVAKSLKKISNLVDEPTEPAVGEDLKKAS